MNQVVVGKNGLLKPVKKRLAQEISAATTTGLRTVWGIDDIAGSITPYRLASILRDASQGDARDYLTLAEEMEECDTHYGSVLGTRKRAIGGLEAKVEAFSDAPKDVELADSIRELIKQPDFGDMVNDLCDALGKGFSVVELVWDQTKTPWQPQYKWRDPRFFEFDRVEGRELRLIKEGCVKGEALGLWKFIAHIPKLKSGLPIRAGLARLAAVSFMCKSYTLKDWMAFAEVFGMPLRLGRYGPGASDDDIKTLISAVANIGSDAAAVLPDSMRIDFQEAARTTGGQELFQKLAEYLDKQISKAVLGQTATTEGTPGKLGNEDAQNDVRIDILKADAKAIANTLNRDLVRPYIDINFGVQENYPTITLPVIEADDLALLADALDKLIPYGLNPSRSEVRDKFGFADPDEGEEVLRVQGESDKAINSARSFDYTAHGKALNQQEKIGPAAPDEIDQIIIEELSDWEAQMSPLISPIQSLLDEAQTAEEFKARMPELLNEMSADALLEALATSAFKARALGDERDNLER